jgi:predicted Zn-dependent peptidase
LPNNHKDRFIISILLNILGQGMSSRLFVEVREKRGLAYMIRSGSVSYRDAGAVYVQAGLDPARLPTALKVIKVVLARLVGEPVTQNELKNAISSLQGRMALAMENSSTQAEWYSSQFLFSNRIETPEQVVVNLKKVTIKDVQRLAKTIFDFNKMYVATIGPVAKNKLISSLR